MICEYVFSVVLSGFSSEIVEDMVEWGRIQDIVKKNRRLELEVKRGKTANTVLGVNE